jgi:hypothetical protein
MHLFAKTPHLLQNPSHLGHNVRALNRYRPGGAIAQRYVQDSTIFGTVDRFAGEHSIALCFQPRLPGQGTEQLQGSISDAIFREIEKNIIQGQGETLETIGFGLKQLAHLQRGYLMPVFLQRLPGLGLIQQWIISFEYVPAGTLRSGPFNSSYFALCQPRPASAPASNLPT